MIADWHPHLRAEHRADFSQAVAHDRPNPAYHDIALAGSTYYRSRSQSEASTMVYTSTITSAPALYKDGKPVLVPATAAEGSPPAATQRDIAPPGAGSDHGSTQPSPVPLAAPGIGSLPKATVPTALSNVNKRCSWRSSQCHLNAIITATGDLSQRCRVQRRSQYSSPAGTLPRVPCAVCHSDSGGLARRGLRSRTKTSRLPGLPEPGPGPRPDPQYEPQQEPQPASSPGPSQS